MLNTRWNMEDAMRVLGNECREEGFMEGEAKGKAESALGMLRDNMPVQLIMKYTQLSLERIKELAAGINVAVVI